MARGNKKQSSTIKKDNDNMSKSQKIMDGVGIWCSFYRANPHRFVKDYLGVNLKLFQKILIYMMNKYFYVMYIASRGQGKTFLTSIYCCTRCILFPQTKVIIASGNLKQATEVLTKIEDLKKDCPNLDREIENIKASKVDGVCTFHIGTWIRVVASNEGI